MLKDRSDMLTIVEKAKESAGQSKSDWEAALSKIMLPGIKAED